MQTQTPLVPAKLERLGRYRIVRPLSKGGMALVYEARRESLAGVSPRVAIKLILPNFANKDSFQELFINEARLGASMHHQNLVQIQDFDRDGDRFFLVMEYVEGLTLRRVIALCARHGIHVPLGVIAELGRQACDGLDYAHTASDEHGRHLGLVHRDIKPSNLILNSHGVVKVLDFGISKGRLMRERKGAVRGTWGYMAPEQAHGEEVSPSSDVFGLGAVLYELAARRPLFVDKSPDEIKRLLMDDHAARMATQLDPAYGPLVTVLVRALQRGPGSRYIVASDFGRALSNLLPDPITARDEVTRFYETLRDLEHGRSARPAEPRRSGASQDSLAVSAPPAAGVSPAWWVAGVSAVVITGLVVLVAAAIALVQPWQGPIQANASAELPATSAASDPDSDRPPPASAPLPGSASAAPTDLDVPPAMPEDPPSQVTVDRRDRPPEVPVEATAASRPEPVPAGPPPEPGRVTIAAAQPGFEVYIDGEYIRTGPLARYEVPSGSRVVTLVATDGRRKTFVVDVPVDGEVRRLWDFDRSEFRK